MSSKRRKRFKKKVVGEEESSKFFIQDSCFIQHEGRIRNNDALYGVFAVKFHPQSDHENGYLLAAIGHPFVKIYKIVEDKILEIVSFDYDSEKEGFYALTWCSSNKRNQYDILALAGDSGNIFCLHPDKQFEDFYLRAHHMEVSQLCTHPSKSYIIASSSYDNSITLWNIRTKVFIARFAGLVHQFGVYDVQFREDGNELLSSDGSQHIAAWSLKSEDIKDKIKESEDMGSRRYPLIEVDNAAKLTRELHGSEIDSILYFSDDYIISKSAANDIVLWKFGEKQLRIGNNLNFAEHDPVKILKRIRQPDLASIHRTFFRLALDRTRNIVVLASMREGKFYSFDFADQNAGLQSHIFPKLDSIVRMFDFTPDGKYLIAGTASRKLYLFSIK